MGWSAPKLKLKKFTQEVTAAKAAAIKAQNEGNFAVAAARFRDAADLCHEHIRYGKFSRLAEECERQAAEKLPSRVYETLGL